jgi:hypothetical protein
MQAHHIIRQIPNGQRKAMQLLLYRLQDKLANHLAVGLAFRVRADIHGAKVIQHRAGQSQPVLDRTFDRLASPTRLYCEMDCESYLDELRGTGYTYGTWIRPTDRLPADPVAALSPSGVGQPRDAP